MRIPSAKNQPTIYLDRFSRAALAGSVQEFSEHFTKGAHRIPPSPTVSSKPESNVKPRGFDPSLSKHGSTSVTATLTGFEPVLPP